ncbi:MAG: T9SS type A sorting domain-containing protein [Prolixibacteraceae bacterium]|jgi:hypothetical protein|nr:T9SS type A sorting domain-containing protein [Prolixibacteraceae bacterium]
MKILFLTITLSFFVLFHSFGQGVIFHEDFESSTIPEGWSTLNVSSANGTWDWSFASGVFSWTDTDVYNFDNNAAIFDENLNYDHLDHDMRMLKHDPIDLSIYDNRSMEYEFSLRVQTSTDSYGILRIVIRDQNIGGYRTFQIYDSNTPTTTVEHSLEAFLTNNPGIDQKNFIFGFIYEDENHELSLTGGAGIGDVKLKGKIINDESCDYRELTPGGSNNASTVGAESFILPECFDYYLGSRGGWFHYTNTNSTKQLVELITTNDDDRIQFQAFSGYCDDLECVRYINFNRNAEEFFEAEPYVDYYIFAYCEPDIVYKLGIWEYQNPPNDEWADATEVTVIPDNVNCTNPTTASLTGATSSYNFWEFGGTNDGDIWYKFVAPSTGAIKMLFPDVSVWERAHIDLYDTPSMLGAIETVEISVSSTIPNSHKFGNLIPGQTYYLRLYSTETNKGTLNFCIQSLTPPSNDNCETATELDCNSNITSDLTNATRSELPDCAETSDNYEGVWYHYNNTNGGVVAIWTENAGDIEHRLEIFQGDCNDMECVYSDYGSSPYFEDEVLLGTDYYIYVSSYTNSAIGEFNIHSLCTYPINDEATGAIEINVNPSGTVCSSPTMIYNNNGASSSESINGIPACGGYQGGDLWYTFEAPTSGSIKIIRPNRGGWSVMSYAVYSTPESNTPLCCGTVDDSQVLVESIPITGLAHYKTYWLRVWEYNNNNFGSVGICLQEVDGINNNIEITNTIISNGESSCFNANNTITVAGNGSIVEFENGSSVNLIAGTSVTLLPGFHAHEGSYVDAHITSNGTFCNNSQISIMSTNPIAEKSLEDFNQVKNSFQPLNTPAVKVYPNPNKGCFKVELEGIDEATQIMIFNSNGTLVHQLDTFDKITTIDLSNKQRGIYLLRVDINGKHFTQKIIIN